MNRKMLSMNRRTSCPSTSRKYSAAVRAVRGHPGPGSRRLGHLAVDQGGLLDNAGVLHFEVEVVAFAGPLAHAGEHRNAAVVHGDVVDHLHHDDGLADAGAAEHAHLAAPREGDEEVDDLDPGLEHVDRGVLFDEGGSLAVDRASCLRLHGPEAVDRTSDDVEDPAQAFRPHRHADRSAGVLRLHPADQAVGDVHGDAADDVVAQMLGDLHDQVVLRVVDGGIGDGEGVQDLGSCPSSNSTSTTGPMTCTIFPMFIPVSLWLSVSCLR